MQNFSQLLQRLAEAGLDFVIVGGYAAVTHGSSYITRVVDICAVLTDENVEKLRRALADWNPKHPMTPQRLSFLLHPPTGQRVNSLYLQTDAGVIDILSSVLGVGDFARLKSHAEELEVDREGTPGHRGQATAIKLRRRRRVALAPEPAYDGLVDLAGVRTDFDLLGYGRRGKLR
ncbi:MAG: hypothetical protein ABI222_10320 [Opitutaceae bacterium]